MFFQCRKDGRHQIQTFPVNQQAFRRITHTDTLTLGIQDDRHHFAFIHIFVNIEDAVPAAGFNDRHGRIFHTVPDQTRTAAGNQQIKVFIHAHEGIRCLMTAVLHQGNAVFINAAAFQRFAHPVTQHAVGGQCFSASAQKADIAASQTQSGRIHTDIRSGLIDDADDADRYASFYEMKISAIPFCQDPAAGIIQISHLHDAVANGFETLVIQGQTVNERFISSSSPGSRNIFLIGLQDLILLFPQQIGHCLQCVFFFFIRQ